MNVENDFSSWNETFYENINDFNKLCLRAKAYFWDWVSSDEGCSGIGDAIMNMCICSPKLTPIEQIWYICYARFIYQYASLTEHCKEINKLCDYIPFSAYLCEGLIPQYKIEYEGKIYVADFVLDFSSERKGKFMFPKFKNLKYVIELDGFDYHNKKQQMNYDYEREQNLQLLGYKIMRFTGSQVYNKPYDCIYKFVSMVFNDIEKEIENGKKIN